MSSSIAIHSKLLLYQTGWWYTYPSEKYEFLSWDDDIPNLWKVIQFHGSKPPISKGYPQNWPGLPKFCQPADWLDPNR